MTSLVHKILVEATKLCSSMNLVLSMYGKADLEFLELEMSTTEIDLFEQVCGLLDRRVHINDSLSSCKSDPGHQRFTGRRLRFGAAYYMHRMLEYSHASPSCFVIAVEYLDRFERRHSAVKLSSNTLQRLLLVAVMTAVKFHEDEAICNQNWYGSMEINSYDFVSRIHTVTKFFLLLCSSIVRSKCLMLMFEFAYLATNCCLSFAGPRSAG